MTLYIKITSFKKMSENGFIIVEGSRAGLLVSEFIKAGDNSFQQNPSSSRLLHSNFKQKQEKSLINEKVKVKFLIMCATQDKLTFKFCQNINKYKRDEIIGMTILNCSTIIKRYSQQLNLDNDFILELELFSQSRQIVGILTCDITFDKVSHYEGQYFMRTEDLASKLIKNQTCIQRMKLYKGKCPTKNLFSMFDPDLNGQNKFIQSIYQDLEDNFQG